MVRHEQETSRGSRSQSYQNPQKQDLYYFLRRTYREAGKVKHETLGNLSDLPDDAIEYVRKRLRGEPPIGVDDNGLEIS